MSERIVGEFDATDPAFIETLDRLDREREAAITKREAAKRKPGFFTKPRNQLTDHLVQRSDW